MTGKASQRNCSFLHQWFGLEKVYWKLLKTTLAQDKIKAYIRRSVHSTVHLSTSSSFVLNLIYDICIKTVYIQFLCSLFTSSWIFGCLPAYGYYEQTCYKQVCVCAMSSFLLDEYLRVELMAPMVSLFQLYKKLPNFFQSGCTIFALPTAMYESSSCSIFFSILNFVHFFSFKILEW